MSERGTAVSRQKEDAEMTWTTVGSGSGWSVDVNDDGRYCVTISEDRAPIAPAHAGPDAGVERDWGNADWPSDAEISAVIGKSVRFADTADGRLDQAIYTEVQS